MIVVTGPARSGTSFIMKTIEEIGYNVDWTDKEHYEYLNEDLFDRYKNGNFSAVKIGGGMLSMTSVGHVKKLIVCHRGKKAASRSLSNYLNIDISMSENIYDLNQSGLKLFLSGYSRQVLSVSWKALKNKSKIKLALSRYLRR